MSEPGTPEYMAPEQIDVDEESHEDLARRMAPRVVHPIMRYRLLFKNLRPVIGPEDPFASLRRMG